MTTAFFYSLFYIKETEAQRGMFKVNVWIRIVTRVCPQALLGFILYPDLLREDHRATVGLREVRSGAMGGRRERPVVAK